MGLVGVRMNDRGGSFSVDVFFFGSPHHIIALSAESGWPAPILSHRSTSARLGSATSYPFFLRTIFSDDLVNYASAAVIDILGAHE